MSKKLRTLVFLMCANMHLKKIILYDRIEEIFKTLHLFYGSVCLL